MSQNVEMTPDTRNESVEKVKPANTTWVYNGNEFEFDMQDIDCAERYEIALAHLQENEKKLDKTGTPTKRIREYDAMFRTLFDDLFGEGGGDAVLGEGKNTRRCDEAFESLIDFVVEQHSQTNMATQSMLRKFDGYMPNRAQRRAASNANKKFKPST